MFQIAKKVLLQVVPAQIDINGVKCLLFKNIYFSLKSINYYNLRLYNMN